MTAVFDVLVGLHIACALVGFVTVGISGVYGFNAAGAGAARQDEELRRYFARPGKGELALLAVPFLGAAALAVQPHGRGVVQLWTGLAATVWLVASALLVGVIRPAERRLAAATAAGDVPCPAGAVLGWGGVLTDLLFVAALALMVWQPH